MKLASATLAAIALSIGLSLSPVPASACNDRGDCDSARGHTKDPKGAPLPLIGASLPGLAIGLGAYWLIKRRRNAT
jgi:hypothetical protein